jgi:signal transduction histidine kinase
VRGAVLQADWLIHNPSTIACHTASIEEARQWIDVSDGSRYGLTIARNLIHGHGGEIRAENIPPTGAMLTFTIPNIST